jgi:hypothetical protein
MVSTTEQDKKAVYQAFNEYIVCYIPFLFVIDLGRFWAGAFPFKTQKN